MSSGSNSQAGFNAQNWAALSLFIQYSTDDLFEGIELEKPQLADFVLTFKNKRIICESKKYTLSYADVRNIFDTIPFVNENDEILIICTGISTKVLDDIKNSRYFTPVKERLVGKHQFTSRHLELLQRLKIWIVDQAMNEQVVRNLLGKRFGSWLPNDELNDMVSNLLVENIYNRSALGGSYSRLEFNAELESRKNKLKEKDDYKIHQRTAKEKVSKLIEELRDPDSRLQSDSRLKAISADPALHYFAIQEIASLKDLELPGWHNFWTATFSSYYSGSVLQIFKNNLQNSINAEYILRFLTEHLSNLRFRSLHGDDYDIRESSELLKQTSIILPTKSREAFNLVNQLYSYTNDDLLIIEQNNDRSKWLKEELSTDFQTIYNNSNEVLKKDIVSYIYENHSLVEDSSEYWHETPHDFFYIISDYLSTHPKHFNEFINNIIFQYQRSYQKYGTNFEGWEIIGGGTSTFQGDYKVEDKFFIEAIIRPYLNTLGQNETWAICDTYIASKIKEVSVERPDFMNRSLIPFLIDQFAANNDRSYQLLSDFIKMRKGIPHKAELVFYFVRNSTMSLDQKWKLLSIALKSFGFPINVFMDQTLIQLLENKHKEALQTFINLLNNENYLSRQIFLHEVVIQALSKVIENPETFDVGVSLLKTYINSKHFIEMGAYDSYDVKEPILSVFGIDPAAGISVLKLIIDSDLKQNHQRLLGAVLRDAQEEHLDKLYSDIVLVAIKRAGNAESFAELFSNIETRENFIWFAEKLSKNRRFDEALSIVDFFINDPNPSSGNTYDGQIVEGKDNFSINTVRGCIPWALLPIVSTPGRAYINRVFEIAKTLCNDQSLYVRHLALLLFEALASNRQARMPNSTDWFMDLDTALAIEKYVFDFMNDPTNHRKAIMQHLARVVTRIRTVSTDQALKAIRIFVQQRDDETMQNISGFIIFMAEFRQDAFKDWPESRGKIPIFDSKPVQILLQELLKEEDSKIRAPLTWAISKLPEEINDHKEFDEFFSISIRHLSIAATKYDNHVFSTIYSFVDRYIGTKFDKTYQLWKACLIAERAALLTESENKRHSSEYSWWAYHKNGSILQRVFSNIGLEQFLQDLEFLLDYPIEVNVIMDIDKVLPIIEAQTLESDRIKQIYEKKLLKRSYLFNASYEKWLVVNKA